MQYLYLYLILFLNTDVQASIIHGLILNSFISLFDIFIPLPFKIIKNNMKFFRSGTNV